MKKSAKLVTLLLLVVMVMTVCLVGCAPKTADDAKAKLEDKGYKVTVIDGSKAGVTIAGMQAVITAYKTGDKNDYVSAIMFDSKESAEKYYATFEEDYNAEREELKNEIKNEKNEDKKAKLQAAYDSMVIKKNGQWIAAGNKDGVKALF